MDVLAYLWDNWLFAAFLAPFLLALVNIIDVYFVSSVYEDEWDGILINSIFQGLPWLLPLLGIVEFQLPDAVTVLVAFLAGSGLALSYFFYFKTLFVSNDAVIVQALSNLSVPLVPFLAWLIIDEKLSLVHYVGIFIAFIGAMLFSLHSELRERSYWRVCKVMSGAIIFFSLSLVLQAEVYQTLNGEFFTGFLLFSAGASITGLALSFFDKKSAGSRALHIFRMSRAYVIVFALAETLNLLGVVVTQRAIELSPSVSFVAVIGSLTPVFVLFTSLFLIPVFFLLNKERSRLMYRDQLVAFKTKIAACCIIAIGIYLIS
ncbi:MAG: hypothetical protein ACEQSB_06075 [Undibacterium sp.]